VRVSTDQHVYVFRSLQINIATYTLTWIISVVLVATIACLIRVLLYRRNIYNFVKHHLELIAIFLKKKIEKKREYVNPDNSVPLRLRSYSACIYWSACLRFQIFTNKHRYIYSNLNNISRYFPLIGDEIVDGEGLNYPVVMKMILKF
jgi:hypothetical protein